MANPPLTSLDTIRKTIDSLDDRIHDLLMERISLVHEIAREKKQRGTYTVHPARETRIIRRLLDRHTGALPKTALVRIWRELMGAAIALQADLRIAVTLRESPTPQNPNHWDMARDYFGSVLPMIRTHNPLSAIGMVRESEAHFAVLPWPEENDPNPWWVYLMHESPDALRITVRLPYADRPQTRPDPDSMALVVSKTPFEPTGHDRSFLAIEVEGGVSRARLLDEARQLDLNPLSLVSRKCPDHTAPNLHLLEVEGYVQTDDPRLHTLLERLDDSLARALCVGGYPVPPVYDMPDTGRAPFASAPPAPAPTEESENEHKSELKNTKDKNTNEHTP